MSGIKKQKRNIYTHTIDLTNLVVKNTNKADFRKKLEEIAYKGYQVEQISDGRKIIITKPGGKFTFGTVKREDFMVWIYNPEESTLWLISHKDIYEDLKEKGDKNPVETLAIIDALERVYAGEEPDEVLKNLNLQN